MRASGSVAIVTPLAQMEVECKTSRNLGGRRPLRQGVTFCLCSTPWLAWPSAMLW